jgi:branched-chain amino acid aminotransferase
MPEVPEDVFMEALAALVKLDEAWVPSGDEASLYVRPFMIATDSFVGVRSSNKYTFSIFTCPVDAYYRGSVRVKVERHFTRATPGGTGYAKAAGNYAGSLYPSELAQKEGYDQLIWTDAVEHEYIEESGTMNAMFIIGGKLVSPQTSDTILNGVTRDSVITIAKDLGIEVEIRKISVTELEEGLKSGRITEAFGVGTAATIKSIEVIGIDGINYTLLRCDPSHEGSIANQLSLELDGIRRGRRDDRHLWNIPV